MAQFGSIFEFEPGRKDWISYTERMGDYFVATGVEEPGKQREILLSCCGASTYQLIRNLVAPGKPSGKTFEEIIQLVRRHHHPPPSEIVERFNFKEGESVAEFVADLRKLSENCKFEASLDNMLRDKLVCGARNIKLQRRLLSEPDLTFRKAFELAQVSEVADQNVKDLQEGQGPRDDSLLVLSRQGRVRKWNNSTCYRCGGTHRADTCRFKSMECFKCKRIGHAARACRSRPTGTVVGVKKSTAVAHQIKEDEDDDSSKGKAYMLFNMTASRERPIMLTMS